MAKKIYHYHPVTRRYTGASAAKKDPKETTSIKYMIPAHATDKKPPALADGEFAEWNGDGWSVKIKPATVEDITVISGVPINAIVDGVLVDRAHAEVERDKWKIIKDKREDLLRQSDWTQLPDVALTEEEVVSWATYRQKLRDMPQEHTVANDVVWPTAPVKRKSGLGVTE